MEKYKELKNIGSGNFSSIKLMRHKETKELVVVKYIPRGSKVNDRMAREIMIHRSLNHPNIIQLKEVVLTPTHIAIVMEYAQGGDLFDRIEECYRLTEDEARYFFQQFISGVSYCHSMEICHRDLCLENILLDLECKSLKICDFGFSKSYLLHSRPKSTLGSPGYIAPEVFSGKEYDGKLADIWSCGAILYVMVLGRFPFEYKLDPQNIKETIKQIMAAEYEIPDYLDISEDFKNLISRIFVADPTKRITMNEMKAHPWFLKNLPEVLTEKAQAIYSGKENQDSSSLQSIEDIMKIVIEAKTLPESSKPALRRWEGINYQRIID